MGNEQKNEWIHDDDWRHWTAKLGFVSNAFVNEEEEVIYLHLALDQIKQNDADIEAGEKEMWPMVTIPLTNYSHLDDEEVIDIINYFNERKEGNEVSIIMRFGEIRIGPFSFMLVTDTITETKIVKACPNCGGAAAVLEEEDKHTIQCGDCGLAVSDDESQGVLVKWNRRK